MTFAPDLDSLTDVLDEATVGYLGDPAIYTPDGDLPRNIKAFVDQVETVRHFTAGAGVAAELAMQVRIADVPDRPGKHDRIEIVRTGKTYSPQDVTLDASGRWWRFGAKPVA